ncbi:MAG: hypothetical protein HQM12_11740 [SAR324 cluster bacterium]|nr:hypothetical protein [SAR324 cluster bacterium]
MFNDDIFERWLDDQAHATIQKAGNGIALSSEDMMILVLKAQSNHFHHLGQELREEIKLVREEIHEESKRGREDFREEIKLVREEMNHRFEQVDKRFEQVDKRFDALIARMDRFMIWSLGLTVSSTFMILGFMFAWVK